MVRSRTCGGVEDASGIEGLLQAPMDFQQRGLERMEDAYGLVASAEKRRMATRVVCGRTQRQRIEPLRGDPANAAAPFDELRVRLHEWLRRLGHRQAPERPGAEERQR